MSDGIVQAVVSLLICIAIVAFAAGLIAAYLVPWVWSLLKPIIHTLTA